MDVPLNQNDDNQATESSSVVDKNTTKPSSSSSSNELNLDSTISDSTTTLDVDTTTSNNAANEFETIQFPDEIFSTNKDQPSTSPKPPNETTTTTPPPTPTPTPTPPPTTATTTEIKDSAVADENKTEDNNKLDVSEDNNKMDYDFTSELLDNCDVGDMLTKATTDEATSTSTLSNIEINTNSNDNKLEEQDCEIGEIPVINKTTEATTSDITNDNTEKQLTEDKDKEIVDKEGSVDNTSNTGEDKVVEAIENVEDAENIATTNKEEATVQQITESSQDNIETKSTENIIDETKGVEVDENVGKDGETDKTNEILEKTEELVDESRNSENEKSLENISKDNNDETNEQIDDTEKMDTEDETIEKIETENQQKDNNDEIKENIKKIVEKMDTDETTEKVEDDDKTEEKKDATKISVEEVGDKIEETKEVTSSETDNKIEKDVEQTENNKDVEMDGNDNKDVEMDGKDNKDVDMDGKDNKDVDMDGKGNKDVDMDGKDNKDVDMDGKDNKDDRMEGEQKLEEIDKSNKDTEDNDKDDGESKNVSENDDNSQDYNDDKDKDEQTNNIEYVELSNELDDNKEDSQMNSLENSTNIEPEKNPLLDDKDDQGIEQEHEIEQETEQGQTTDHEADEGEQDPVQDKETATKDDAIEDDTVASDEVITGLENADEALCMIPEQEPVQSEKDEAYLSRCELTPPPPKEYTVKTSNSDSLETCRQCKLKRKTSFVVTRRSQENENEYVCSDTCLDAFKKENEDNYFLEYNQIRIRNFTKKSEMASMQEERACMFCKNKTDDEENNLTWELMDFCNEFCLWKYQKQVGSQCATCSVEVPPNSLGKYCVRFGDDIRQFCSSNCLEDYKKGLKVCSYCQQDMSKNTEGFLAPVGDKGQFKDFCSQTCMEKYDMMTNNRPPKVDKDTRCSVCNNDNDITIQFETKDGQNYFCSDRCFVAFSFVNNIVASRCSMCRRYYPNEILRKRTVFYDNIQYNFCSNSCQNIYIIAHRKIVPCAWCKVKKYNFDMIRRYFKAGTVLNMCSIHCLNLFQVSINAVSSKKTLCNYCNKRHQPMYHLTMSDASIRNFCSYNCVMSFQNKFKKSPITLNNGNDEQSYPVPAGEPKKSRKFALTEASISKSVSSPPLPVISNVQSLANKTNNQSGTINGRPKTTTTSTNQPHILNASVTSCDVPVKVKHHIIIKPAPIPEQRNVATMCKVKVQHKSTQHKPLIYDKAVQTDKEAQKAFVPIPVPLVVPSANPFYCIPVPYPLAFPVPIPVPIFIPTTRNSAKGIMKEIKKIQVKIPTDPYEAELLMMAEMVAGDKKEENTDSESDVEDTTTAAAPATAAAAAGGGGGGGGGDESGTFSPEPVDASNAFGDDMLQMALKMATELEEPAVDLEGALTANTITASQTGSGDVQNDENVDDPQPLLNTSDRRGRKRGSRGGKQSSGNKKRRISQPSEACVAVMPTQPVASSEPAEKPDAHLCLKYTFGVNAWKQWVTTKNQAEMEKSTKFVKPFKTEILQLTADELNYSLCLFVKEVRKPNGAEYAPDTIYYLCLGIQQYLFENGRIDNIFCDPYYEQFTDSLDEVARKFSVLYNDSHYIVTRVEEEHLWESKQLGAHSPHVLLSTLMFFNTKHFNLTTVEEHMQLSFSHIMKHWKRNPNQSGVARVPGSRNVLLRFYPPQSAMQNNSRKKKVYEQQENEENPLRCPVKLYEFYLSKCPESVKTRNDVFYLQPERSCVPDSPVWYSTTALPREALEKMLHRVKMVKEINVALLTS